MTDKLRDDLTRNLNALRAAASRGPVTSREIFQMTDGIMDLLSRAALAAAPPPAPAPADERAAMIEVIVQADDAYDRVQGGTWAGAIADALLARGLRLPGGETKPRRCAECDCEGGEYECNWIKPGPDRDNALQQLADLGQICDRIAPETMAWAVVGSEGQVLCPDGIFTDDGRADLLKAAHYRVKRVAIRVVEGCDDAA